MCNHRFSTFKVFLMNRSEYFNYIDDKLHVLARRIVTRGKLNILDLHVHSENFYCSFFNLLYDFKLVNLNDSLQNVEAIDLIDHTNKIIIQVSATNTKSKVELALNKPIIKEYSEYTFKFVSIAKDASNLQKNTFINPFSISFAPAEDIYDIATILGKILNLDIEDQKHVYQFIKNELGNEIDQVKLDSNLAAVINILAQIDLNESDVPTLVNSFEIERKITYNDLASSKYIINEYSVYYGKVDSIYSEFDSLGNNKSISVHATIRREYLSLNNYDDKDKVFYAVIDAVKNKIQSSVNFIPIPIDELELCVDILVVDAFIRCRIFKNPEGYEYASS